MTEAPTSPDAAAPVQEIRLREHAPAASVPLDTATGKAIAAARVLESAAPDPFRPGHWTLRAGSTVGTVRVPVPGRPGPGLTLRITPKTPVRRLFFLLGFSLSPERAWRDGGPPIDSGTHDDVVPALAHAVERQIDLALRQGVLQGYRSVEESALVVRGRIREAEQIRRHFGRTPPVEIAYDDYSTDTAENRILRGAVESLLRVPGIPSHVRRRLAHQRLRLADASPLVRGQALPRWTPSRLNARYQPALRLAEAVLRGTSPEHHPGDVPLTGFLLDMNVLFEDFVTCALLEAVRELGFTARLQDPLHLDTAQLVRMRPDLTVRSADGTRPVAVVDAKYKTQKAQGGYPNADLYQMLAYCTVLGLAKGHLVYAAGDTTRTAHEVATPAGLPGVQLYRHVLDLDREPAELLTTFRQLAATLTASHGFPQHTTRPN
ncbi:McrC family protein [Streptomyces luteolus]|uniref:Restriction endonuclease n=1 Tax=Streptomyces luteolus TaxID=3043615 RepID=A0ABT6SX20_9ACTN|nr:restriction endonuclease [Streptomyces sp. B-S-A12]MDI3420134.1 restriction endonuclease [Streptomyces sp. B-S-A12]